MASSAVSLAAKQIGQLLVDEAKYLYRVKDKVEALHDELIWMHCFLQDADTRQHKDKMIHMWVSQIRDFAYDAEDALENYLHKVSSHRQEGICNTFKWFSCICIDAKSLYQVGSDIDRLKQRISELSSRMQIYGVKAQNVRDLSHTKRVMELRRTWFQIDSNQIVGLSGDADDLVEKLAEFRVVCVTGMGGLGKTTLAKMVHDHNKLKAELGNNRVWVYVSQHFQVRNILEAILLNLGYVDGNSRNVKDLRDEELPEKVSQMLKEKRCLVVLDDVWKQSDWDVLAPAFASVNHSQSKLLLTTRKENLLLRVDSHGYHHQPKLLDKSKSWELLKKKAFPGTVDQAIDKEMEEVGSNISQCCKGLPLALVVVGGILATKTSTLDEWKKVQKNVNTFLAKGKSEQGNLSITQVLELSYYDLPYYLKPCFLHLGSFPEDAEIQTERLYHMWVVEGAVAQARCTAAAENSEEDVVEDYLREESSEEDIAEGYLKELASRCLVQLGGTGENGKIKSCRLHDLIRDMCQRKSEEENFLNVIEHGDSQKKSSRQSLRRLAIYMHKSSNILHQLISDQNTDHVRSLSFFPAGEIQCKLEWPQGKVGKALNLVRVLDFENVCIRSLPRDIGGLIHLKYLSLKGTRISSLPSSIAKLKYLQILDLRVRESIDVIIHEEVWRLEKLKHLYLPKYWEVRQMDNKMLVNLYSMVLLRTSIAGKRKLRLRGLSQLETVENLRLENCHVQDLQKLEKLKKVWLADYIVTDRNCLKSFLKCPFFAERQPNKPLRLAIDGNVISQEPGILASSSQLLVQRLEISGKISLSLSCARIFPEYLKQLTLTECELKDDPMSVLEKLTQLRELTLGENSFMGTQMECTAANFPRLANLKLIRLKNLNEWVVHKEAMPVLENLYIHFCENLAMTPAGLKEGIKLYRLSSCRNSDAIP